MSGVGVFDGVPVKCRCGALVIWTTMAMTGRRLPLEPMPSPAGNVMLSAAGAYQLDGEEVAANEGHPLFVNHHSPGRCSKRNRRR